MRYLAVLHQDRPDGPVGVTVPDLPGCTSAGDTAAEALAGAAEAVGAWIECAQAYGEPVPSPSVSIDPDGGRVAVVEIEPADPVPERAARLNITLPARIRRPARRGGAPGGNHAVRAAGAARTESPAEREEIVIKTWNVSGTPPHPDTVGTSTRAPPGTAPTAPAPSLQPHPPCPPGAADAPERGEGDACAST